MGHLIYVIILGLEIVQGIQYHLKSKWLIAYCLLFEIQSRTFHLKRDLCIQSNRLWEASGLHDIVCKNKKSMNNAFCKHPTTEEIKHADFYLMGPWGLNGIKHCDVILISMNDIKHCDVITLISNAHSHSKYCLCLTSYELEQPDTFLCSKS